MAARKAAAKPKRKLMTKTAYARARGVDPAGIFKAEREGRLRTINGLVDPAEADLTWYRRYLQRHDGMRSGAEAEARREQAITQSVAAKLMMTRRKADQLRHAVADRDKSQGEIGNLVTDLMTVLSAASLDRSIVQSIIDDLGDLQAEALTVTR